MNWFWIAGAMAGTLFTPIILFQIGKCHMRRELRKNILELSKIKENSNEEISALIDIHFEELKKLDKSLLETLKNKNL